MPMASLNNPGASRNKGWIAPLLLAWSMTAAAQDNHIALPIEDLERMFTEPLVITEAQVSRPKAKGDITLRADVAFGNATPLRVKLRRAEPGADDFNNVPRYDLAAYELQKLFLDPAEYVVPPTAIRMIPVADFAKYTTEVQRTFKQADQVMVVVQYWLNDIKVIADVYDAERFASDPLYARHIGQLNVLTYLIEHRDSNLGNFLIGNAETGARVFSIDHGVAFASIPSDRGELWKDMRIALLPEDLVSRLRQITPEILEQELSVLAQWQLENGTFVPVTKTANLSERTGVRRDDGVLQMGLTRREINTLYRRLQRLLEQIDRNDIVIAAR